MTGPLREWLEATAPRGTLPPRARLRSNAPTLDLGGVWECRHTPQWRLAPPIAASEGPWAPIAVPGMWQLQGFGSPVYLSAQYPFPLDPPRVPDENALMDYRLEFAVPATFLDGAVLRFDGIDSSGLVWLNGRELGWTKGSRLTHEFDVTDDLREQGNVLIVRVAQYNAGSYLEAQDMWWLSGIFREVTLIATPPGGIRDLVVHADFDVRTGAGELALEVSTGDPERLSCHLAGWGEVPGDGSSVRLDGIAAWTAETPALHDLIVATPAETVTLRVGFRRVEIVDGLLRVNGVPIRFRGVNRHDHDPVTGRRVTPEAIRRDLVMMKRANINAIRTAHYPPHPALLELADDFGFWVIEEGDIETHGFVLTGFRGNPVDDPAWEPAVLDRTERLLRRDRNHACVVVWSLGNESGTGRCLASAYRFLKQEDPSRPVHYERDRSYAYSDIVSLMYTPPDRLDEIGRGIDRPDEPQTAAPAGKPFLLCEYGHAMGAGPGALADYEELFDRHPRLQGGFVWEWCDHTLWTSAPDGTRYLGYGGDFGELLHDGSFAADGLVGADRTPRPALADYAATIAPFRLEISPDDRVLRVRNRHDFLTADGFWLSWQLAAASGVRDTGVLDWPAVLPPGGSATILLPERADPREAGEPAVLTVQVWTADARADAPMPVAAAQRAVGFDGYELPEGTGPARSDGRGGYELGSARFGATGQLLTLAGVPFSGPRVGLWRAPTDNDYGLNMKAAGQPADADGWARANLKALGSRLDGLTAGPGGLVTDSWVAPLSRDAGLRLRATWQELADGLRLQAGAEPTGAWEGTWARVGLDFESPGLPAARIRWQGRGPGPAGPDTGQGTRWGWFEATVADWQVAYARPQDNGVRAGVTRLWLELPDGRWLEIASALPLAVSVRPWTDLELDAAHHPHELVATDRLVVSLNAAVHGLGSGACGPLPLPPHRLHPGAARWDLRFRVMNSDSVLRSHSE